MATEEIVAALEALTAPQLLRLEKFARYRVRGLGRAARWRDHKDLLGEAVTSTLAGNRRWNKKVSLDAHLFGAMRSISTHWREQYDPTEASLESELLRRSEEGETYSPMGQVPSCAPDAERVAAAKEKVERIVQLFADDLYVSLILTGWHEGKTGREIQEMLGIPQNDYDAAIRRMRRNIPDDLWEGTRRNVQ